MERYTDSVIYNTIDKKAYYKGKIYPDIPFSENEIIWFNQFDVRLAKVPLTSGEDMKFFTKEILKNFPPLVQNILEKTDFSQSYLWNTKDFDTLKSFHKNNINHSIT